VLGAAIVNKFRRWMCLDLRFVEGLLAVDCVFLAVSV